MGIVWGIGLSADSAGWAAGTIVASHEYALEANQKEILNVNGDAVGLVFSNIRKAITVEVIPANSSSIANARTANTLPAIGTTVTIADTASTDIDGLYVDGAAKYIFIGGSKTATQDGEQRMTLNLVQYVANDISATIT